MPLPRTFLRLKDEQHRERKATAAKTGIIVQHRIDVRPLPARFERQNGRASSAASAVRMADSAPPRSVNSQKNAEAGNDKTRNGGRHVRHRAIAAGNHASFGKSGEGCAQDEQHACTSPSSVLQIHIDTPVPRLASSAATAVRSA